MPTLSYIFPYEINNPLVLSPQELDSIYLFGIDFKDPNGNSYPEEDKKFHIANAQEAVENLLNIKLTPQVIKETLNYDIRMYWQWGYLKTSFPVREAFSLKGFVGSGNRQITYPADWLTPRRTNDSKLGYERAVNIVPNGTDNVSFTDQAIFSTLYPGTFYSSTGVPEYFEIIYTTGYDSLPRDILGAIGKIASVDVLNILGDIALGAGIASQSLSIDGLSQSIGTTQSAENNALSARVRQYLKELESDLPKLKDRYRGIGFSTL